MNATQVGTIIRSPLALPGAIGRGLRRLLRSVRFWTFFLLGLIVLLVLYYALSDTYAPFTRDAYVQAYVVQVAARVEGEVVKVHVRENQFVAKGTVLFEIDPQPFQHKVRQLEAKVAQMTQQIAQMKSELAAEKAEEARIVADEAYAKAVFDQESLIYEKASTTERKYLDAVKGYKAAQALREKARAQVRQKEQALRAKVGPEFALVAEARAELATARLNLDWTTVHAPADGYVTNLQLRKGSYAHAGRPVLSFIDADEWWVVANFRENNLEHVRVGQPVAISFNTYPGRIFQGTVQSVGWGVGEGQGVPSGDLPTVRTPQEWVRPAQRFQVRVAFDRPAEHPLRVGATAAVTVYTSEDFALNPLAGLWQRVNAWLNYLR